MAATFLNIPDRGFGKTTKARVLTYQYGDGYSQRLADGINNFVNTWSLTFSSQVLTVADDIITFFETTGGYQYFFWTPPGELTEIKVIASDWSKNYESPISRNISVTFTQVFDL